MDSLVPSGAGTPQDNLKWTLDAARQIGGMEVYAWFEYGLIAAYGEINNDFAHEAKSRGWILGQEGEGFIWMDPDNNEALTFFSGILQDCWTNYSKLGLKGLQLDDHFSSPVSLGRTKESMDNAMQRVRKELQVLDKEVFLSLAPSPLDQALNSYNVDWNTWGSLNLFDEVIPQLYRSSFQSFKRLFDETLKGISSTTRKYFKASGIRVDGSGDPTPLNDVKKSIEYSESYLIGTSIWYCKDIVELYPDIYTG
jgi:uncharacterized lipoprotein YddW (UPF0748 family)